VNYCIFAIFETLYDCFGDVVEDLGKHVFTGFIHEYLLEIYLVIFNILICSNLIALFVDLSINFVNNILIYFS
jgi:hypothetical protein